MLSVTNGFMQTSSSTSLTMPGSSSEGPGAATPLRIDASGHTEYSPGPASAAISIGTSWGGTQSSSTRHSMSTDGEMEPPLPLSSSSSSSPSQPHFVWPGSATVSTAAPLTASKPDPFDATQAFSDDPFDRPSSGSSSEDEIAVGYHGARYHDGGPSLVAPGFSFAPMVGDLAPPSFNRTFSSPLPARVGHLKHPMSPPTDPYRSYNAHPSASSSRKSSLSLSQSDVKPLPALPPSAIKEMTQALESLTIPSEPVQTPLQTLSLELADSLQSAIQTLLHLSPPHMLDNAKEQYSGCTVQMPTTSLSALLTSMKGLNYLSANVQALCHEQHVQGLGILDQAKPAEDFDIGELVQSVADLLSGQAAQLGVDMVLFHGDVGIKHVSVRGDGQGLGYALSHVLRQILLVASKGDTIELGLQLVPQSPSMTPRVAMPLTAADVEQHKHNDERPASPGRTLPLPPSGPTDGPLLCVIEIVHNIAQSSDNLQTPKAELNPFTSLHEQSEIAKPRFDSLLCRRLLAHVNASLRQNTTPSSPQSSSIRRAYELSILAPRGQPIAEPPELSKEEEAIRQPFTNTKLGREPTLPELAAFAESLRGRRVDLHASLSSVFARHLTSYLAAWGMDISHHPIEEDLTPGPTEVPLPPDRHDSGYGGSNEATPGEPAPKEPKFVIIDDDLTVLRRELIKMKVESPAFNLKPRLTRRPSLKTRARSSPQIRQIQNLHPTPRTPSAYLIHFTSLSNYNQVRDLVATLLATPGSGPVPEVMVVPKPVGPRRFLTALHTAISQPLVDPSFSPIATSPRSPGGGYFPGARTPAGSDLGREPNFFDTVVEEEAVDIKRSPEAELPRDLHLSIPTPGISSDVLATPAHEYFSGAAAKMGSAASGIVVQSPDGRPFGMFFEPPTRGEGRRGSYTARVPSEGSVRRKSNGRRMSIGRPEPVASTSATPSTSRRSSKNDEELRRTRTEAQERPPLATASSSKSVLARTNSTRRKTLPPGAPVQTIVAPGRERSATVTQGSLRSRPSSPPLVVEAPITPAAAKSPKAVAKKRVEKPKDGVVVPPINVLIVEDNPINQNILSMFLRKKKIRHQAAKDGLEAVEKWRTGGFHLILMDIQLPVMDGIEATKEIRKLERNNNIGIFPSTPMSESARPLEQVAASPFRSSVIIVALTASSLQSDRVSALAAGCNDFLTKPVSLKWLERKIIEWGCMQALIDFDGWRRWKTNDGKDETKRGFQLGPDAKAKTLASRLRIERTKSRPEPPPVMVEPPPPEPQPELEAPAPSATLSSIEEDAETSGAPNPQPPKRSKAARVGFDMSVDPRANADDGPQPDSAPSSGDSADGKPLPALPS